MIYLLLIIIIIVLVVNNNNLKNDIELLKNRINTLNNQNNGVNYCPKCGFDIRSSFALKRSNNNSTNIQPVLPEKEIVQTINKKQEMSEREIKNSTILTVGAILIIIAAIVFLTSTWNTSLDIVKTLIIFFMFIVFLGASFIADKYLKIPQTSKVFLYLALSYLPLVFLSTSLFHLLGDYLSIAGEGRYIYLFISSIILSLIYYYIMQKKKDIFFAIGSLIFQVISTILLSLIFTNNITIIFILLALYNIVFYYFYNKEKYYYSKTAHNLINITLTLSTTISSIFFLTGYNLFIKLDICLIIYVLLMYYNHYNLVNKTNYNYDNKLKIFSYTSPIHILITSLLIGYIFNVEFIMYQLLLIIGIIISYFIDYLLNNKLSFGSFIISSIFYLAMYLLSFSIESIIPSYYIILLYCFFVLFNTKYIDENKKYLNMIISIPFYIFIINLCLSTKIDNIVLPIISLLSLVGSYLINNKNEIVKYLRISSIVFSLICFLITLSSYYESYILLAIISIIYTIVFYVITLLEKQTFIKILSYLFVILSLSFIASHTYETINLNNYILPVSTLIIFILESLNTNEDSKIFLIMMFIISFLSIVVPNNNILSITIFLILTIIFIIFIEDNKENKDFFYLPLVSFSIYLINNTYLINNIDILLIISLLLTIILLYIFIIDKNKRYIFMSLTLLLVTILSHSINKYFAIFMFLISFLVYYLFSDNKYKDLYKAGIYIIITILVRFIISDLLLNNYTVLLVGPYIISFILISRTIIKKYNKDYKILEYIILSILYLLSIGYYKTELNGMLFVFLLVILTIISYYKKWGPIFITSLIFILINAFILTRMFWLSLPWWVYLLVIGSILIAFAINNELKEKNNYKDKLKNIIEKIDM